MAKADLKTKENDSSVLDFINSIDHKQRREDSLKLVEFFKNSTGYPAKMWGGSIIGFGKYHYKYDSGREGDMLLAGFSPRKTALTIYLMARFTKYDELLSRLGKYKTGKSCLYVKKLEDIDLKVLDELVISSMKMILEKYPD